MKEEFQRQKGDPSSTELARKCLLPPTEVSFWIEHLQQVRKNRKRGAAKAVATRRLRRQHTAESMEIQFLI